jgi:SAM-dependent methyltransferase
VHALLVRPAANRVFAGDAPRLLAAELAAVTGLAAEVTTIAGVEYVTFEGDADLRWVAALSSTYALFERDGELLRPVELPAVDRYDEDLLTTQRYVGRTNETFTKLLVNLALATAGRVPGERARVLDPLCGRGTTLNQALTYGADAVGVDLDGADVQHYRTFLTTWLQEKRLKHQVDATAGRHRFRVEIGPKGAAHAAERQTVDVVVGDTTEAATAFGRSSVDALVADLPYGVQHGSRAGADLDRKPDDLLRSALPAWRRALRPGAGVALSWNTRILRRDDLVALLTDAGYDVQPTGDDGAFVHRVDRTITRDLVVARAPR